MSHAIRWMIRRDLPTVLELENLCFEHPWREQDFLHCLKQRSCIGMVAERTEEIDGYMIYTLHRRHIELLNIAVRPSEQRTGVGSQMLAKLRNKLDYKRRSHISTIVRERNLAAQLFFRSCGYLATDICREHFDTGEAGYQFVIRAENAPGERAELAGRA